mgnify:CR=1 FL=1
MKKLYRVALRYLALALGVFTFTACYAPGPMPDDLPVYDDSTKVSSSDESVTPDNAEEIDITEVQE